MLTSKKKFDTDNCSLSLPKRQLVRPIKLPNVTRKIFLFCWTEADKEASDVSTVLTGLQTTAVTYRTVGGEWRADKQNSTQYIHSNSAHHLTGSWNRIRREASSP